MVLVLFVSKWKVHRYSFSGEHHPRQPQQRLLQQRPQQRPQPQQQRRLQPPQQLPPEGQQPVDQQQLQHDDLQQPEGQQRDDQQHDVQQHEGQQHEGLQQDDQRPGEWLQQQRLYLLLQGRKVQGGILTGGFDFQWPLFRIGFKCSFIHLYVW